MSAKRPGVRKRRVGSALREFRERSGMTAVQAAAVLGISGSMMSHVESGNRVMQEPELLALLDAYGVTDAERERVLTLGRDSRRTNWFKSYERLLSPGFRDYLSLESEATEIRDYQPLCVPGLLQTSAYARAVLTSGLRGRPDVESLLSVRMARQQILERADPPQMHTIVDEPVLRRPIGGRAVLVEQLRRLRSLAERPHILLQILRHDHETGVVVTPTSFVTLRFPETGADVVFLENAVGGNYLESRADIRTYGVIFNQLCEASLSPGASAELIARTAEELGE